MATSSNDIRALESAMAAATGWQRAESMAELASSVQPDDPVLARNLATDARALLEAADIDDDAPRRDAALALSLVVLASDRLASREHADALELATTAGVLAGKAGAARTLVRAESIVSSVLVVRGSLAEARELLARRLEAMPEAEDREREELRGRLLNNLGRVHFHAGEPERARECFLEALELLRGGGEVAVQAVCLTNLANVLSHVGDAEGALETFARSLAMHRAVGSSAGVALALHNLAVTHDRIGDHEAALQHARDADDELSRRDPHSIRSTNLIQLATSLLALGQAREALVHADRAIAVEEACANDVGVARALTCRARVLGVLDRVDEGLADARRALGILDGRAEPAWRTRCHEVIAELHLRQGLPDEALRIAEPLVDEAHAVGDAALEVSVVRLVVQSARRAGRHEKALDLSDRLQALEAEAHRRERTQQVETLKLRHQLDQGRQREEALRVARAELEVVVSERTKELVAANKDLTSAIAARDRADGERRRLEEQLRHAQKMEAMGRVAGEVAHDFNNLLTVVTGNAALLLADLDEDDPRRVFAQSIDAVAARGADLTRQLLAFSRKAAVNPTLLDVNDLVRGAEGMIRSVAGPRVEITTRLSTEIGPVRADRAQLEQVLMNLVTNARDAMPEGGRLILESRAVDVGTDLAMRHPGALQGPHVVLSLTDTGHGMDAATQAMIFEPFFTTKDAGKGTGLGLSVAFGVVQQCGGFVSVESRPGEGARFGVHLPRVSP